MATDGIKKKRKNDREAEVGHTGSPKKPKLHKEVDETLQRQKKKEKPRKVVGVSTQDSGQNKETGISKSTSHPTVAPITVPFATNLSIITPPITTPSTQISDKLSKKKEKRKQFKKELKAKLKGEKKFVWGKKKMSGKKENKVPDTPAATTSPPPKAAPKQAETTLPSTSVKENPKTASKKPNGLSSNWKSLQQELKMGTGKKKKKKKRNSVGGGRGEGLESTRPSTENSEEPKAEKPEIWFEIDDQSLIDGNQTSVSTSKESPTTKSWAAIAAKTPPSAAAASVAAQQDAKEITNIVGLDCEMVGVGEDGQDSILARISIVNHHGHAIYDKFVKPTEAVTDYRTAFSGVRPHNLKEGAHPFKQVQSEVADLLKGRILVGHALNNDLQVLFLSHPRRRQRDTQKYKPFKKVCGGMPSLKKLAASILKVDIQTGEHNSVEDAQTAMRLYMMHRTEWEREVAEKKKKWIVAK